MQPNMTWHVSNTHLHNLCPGNSKGPLFQYASPKDPFLGCPGNCTPVPRTHWMVDPRHCGYYEPACEGVGVDGDLHLSFRAIDDHAAPYDWEWQFDGTPDRWLCLPTPFSTGGNEVLACTDELARIMFKNLFFFGNNEIGATDYPPGYVAGDWPVTNGWATYPDKMMITYTEMTDEELDAQGHTGPYTKTFQYNVYNMRFDVIGGSGGHIESGGVVDLSYPTTDHGGGDFQTWDVGGIGIEWSYVKEITGIWMQVPSVGEQSVGTVIIQGEEGFTYDLEINTTGGTIDGIHNQVAESPPLTVTLNIDPTEII